MARRKKTPEVTPSIFETTPYMEVKGFPINKGDIIKIQGEYGSKFKFVGLTKNTVTGAVWVDCFQIIGTVPSVFRSFRTERVKRIPQRGKRAKRVV